MKAFELELDKMYGLPGLSDTVIRVVYCGREGNRYWFKGINGSFWMNEKQIETLLMKV